MNTLNKPLQTVIPGWDYSNHWVELTDAYSLMKELVEHMSKQETSTPESDRKIKELLNMIETDLSCVRRRFEHVEID